MKPQVAMQDLIAGDAAYTTTLGSTVRAAFRNLPLRAVRATLRGYSLGQCKPVRKVHDRS